MNSKVQQKRQSWFGYALYASVILFHPAVSAAVYNWNGDNRKPVSKAPISGKQSLGTIVNGKGRILGTGFIADVWRIFTRRKQNIIVTAGHLFCDTQTRKPLPGKFFFKPVTGKGAVYRIYPLVAGGLRSLSRFCAELDPLSHRDFAFASVPGLPLDKVEPLVVRRYSRNRLRSRLAKKGQVLFAGYDTQTRRFIYSDQCRLFYTRRSYRYSGTHHHHDCDLSRGSSGGPLLLRYGKKIHVIGIQNAEPSRVRRKEVRYLDQANRAIRITWHLEQLLRRLLRRKARKTE